MPDDSAKHDLNRLRSNLNSTRKSLSDVYLNLVYADKPLEEAEQLAVELERLQVESNELARAINAQHSVTAKQRQRLGELKAETEEAKEAIRSMAAVHGLARQSLSAGRMRGVPGSKVVVRGGGHRILGSSFVQVQKDAFFSDIQPNVTIPAAPANQAMPTVVLPNWAGRTISHVFAGFKFRMLANTNAAANKIDALQYIQVQRGAGALVNCINIPDDVFSVPAGVTVREGGDMNPGNLDVVGTVDRFNDTYNFQWTAADADVASLVFVDVMTYLVVSHY